MVSSELYEIIVTNDRTIVMHKGKLIGEFLDEEITQEAVIVYS